MEKEKFWKLPPLKFFVDIFCMSLAITLIAGMGVASGTDRHPEFVAELPKMLLKVFLYSFFGFIVFAYVADGISYLKNRRP